MAIEKYTLRKTQRNQVLSQIQAAGMSPSEFVWDEQHESQLIRSEGFISVLRHVDSGFSFVFDLRDPDSFWYTARPGMEAPKDYENCRDWTSMLHAVGRWVHVVKEESEATDLWDEVINDRDVVDAAIGASGDEQFSPDERELLRQGLARIEDAMARNAAFQETERSFLHERLAYLAAGLDRMSRHDWIHTTIGVFFTIVVSLQFSAEEARGVFAMLGRLFAGVAQTIQGLLE